METRHPRFSSLAQAVRAGIQLVPEDLGCDSLVGAWFAEYSDGTQPEEKDLGLQAALSTPLNDAYPVLLGYFGPVCPIEADECRTPGGGWSVEAKIIHLEGEHEFSREQVARWLQDRDL
jgi:hypothetical protein